jgi:hypothetical protein
MVQAGFVAFLAAHLEQLGVVGQALGQLVEREHHAVELLFFLAQVLGLLGVVPDRRVFQRGVDGSQALGLGSVVKDTPVARRCGAQVVDLGADLVDAFCFHGVWSCSVAGRAPGGAARARGGGCRKNGPDAAHRRP